MNKLEKKCRKYKEKLKEKKLIIKALLRLLNSKNTNEATIKNGIPIEAVQDRGVIINKDQHGKKLAKSVVKQDFEGQSFENNKDFAFNNVLDKYDDKGLYRNLKECTRADENINRFENEYEIQEKRLLTKNVNNENGTKNLYLTTNNDKITHDKETDVPKNSDLCTNFDYLHYNEILNESVRKEENFKQNSDLKTFLNFLSTIKEIPKDNKNILNYIKNNKKGILNILFANFNNSKFYDNYAVLKLIAPFFDNKEKPVLVHDIIVFTNNLEMILPLSYAVLYGASLKETVLEKTIYTILSQQASIDWNSCGSRDIKCIIENIIIDLKLNEYQYDLEEYAKELAKPMEIIFNGKINNELFVTGISLRMICSYLDWDYMYKTFISKYLFKNLAIQEEPAFLFYVGILAMDAFKRFGKQEAVASLFKLLEKYLEHESIVFGLISYLFLKQYKIGYKNEWLDLNKEKILRELYIEEKYIANFIS